MTQTRRTSRRLRSITVVAAVMVAAAVLVTSSAQATMTFRSSSITLGVRDSTPSGAVGEVQSPAEAGSTLSLTIDASDTGSGLASAQASIDGNTASVSLCSAPPCPEAVSNIPLSIDVGTAGSHVLLVTVTDAVGNTGTLLEAPIEVLDPLPPGSNTVTVGISAMHEGPPVEPPEEPTHKHPLKEPPPRVPPVCPSPMLEMRLASAPLGYTRKGVPVLRRGRRYRFTGRLTCLHGHRRASAPNGTPVRVLYRAGRRTFKARPGTMLMHGGSLSAMFAFKSARTIIFRYNQAGGEDVEVRISTAIARRDPHNHRGRRRGRAR
ncbi:MAG TPA: hypothetical protein VK730_11565 [Solirubrobacteraceae bacterium]|jgi:hypothetical protein|nr:hypothetical protein [Solirubrobacteraceae bacterium]